MTREQFIAWIEMVWGKESLGKLRQLYLSELERFTEPQLEMIFSAIIKRCTFLPKIAEIYQAAGQLDFLDAPASTSINSQKKEGGCLLCDGLGWQRVTLPHPKGGDYEAVRECTCTGREIVK